METNPVSGLPILDTFVVECAFADGSKCDVEFLIEPDIIMQGHAMRPGVVYQPELYGQHPFHGMPEDVGEIIAYAINEGGVVSDSIAAAMVDDDEDDRVGCEWRVKDPEPLYRHHVLDRAQQRRRYVVRDRATEGADYFVWGDDCPDKAWFSVEQAMADGIEVELLVMNADQMDDRTRELIEG